jgi:hypothetical protein
MSHIQKTEGGLGDTCLVARDVIALDATEGFIDDTSELKGLPFT